MQIRTDSPDLKKSNRVKNSKYTKLTFFFSILINQHKHFTSLYFTIIMLFQFKREFGVSSFSSSFLPWAFVMCLTFINEGLDDYARHCKDAECNSQIYLKLTKTGYIKVRSADLKPGDIIKINKGDRIPADLVLLKAKDANSELFIKTDQLDGETDWKRRVAPYYTQNCSIDSLFNIELETEDPHKDIYSFSGALVISNYSEDLYNNEVLYSEKTHIETVNEEKINSEDSFLKKANDDIQLNNSELNNNEEADDNELNDNGEINDNELDNDQLNNETNAINQTPYESIEENSLIEDNSLDEVKTEQDDQPDIVKTSKVDDRLVAVVESEGPERREGLDLDNAIWANTMAATTSGLGMVVYTGENTRAALNSNAPRDKDGTIERELDMCTFILALLATLTAAIFTLMRINGFDFGFEIFVVFVRFIILFSYVIPISLKVTINMARMCYAKLIDNDSNFKGVKIRSTSMQEELGRISYLLSDKTGTLTRNEMVVKRIHLGTVCFNSEDPDFENCLKGFDENKKKNKWKTRKPLEQRCFELAEALGVCHSVTPVEEEYQASSPDELAILSYLKNNGFKLVHRTRDLVRVYFNGRFITYKIKNVFSFSSTTKRMGVVVEKENGDILYVVKGADTALSSFVMENDWSEGATDNMAREGLRTLHVAVRTLPEDEYKKFSAEYTKASLSIKDRSLELMKCQMSLEKDMELIGLTGVEDKLQENIQQSLESLKNAGIAVWMLTGDKRETAISIAKSSRLFSKHERYLSVCNATAEKVGDAVLKLSEGFYTALVIDGSSLSQCNESLLDDLIRACTRLDAVVGCRLSPTQKADVALIIRKSTGKSVCSIGDGGNDVSMINAADVGIGIEGKEGNQASTAADVSVTQFDSVCKLLFFHGRRCYMSSSCIALIIMHRGIIISVIQAIFCALIHFFSIALFQGEKPVLFILLTFCPLGAIANSYDLSCDKTMSYPELYKELVTKNLLGLKQLLYCLLQSFLQGFVIMYGFIYFKNEFFTISTLSFSALVINELIMIVLSAVKINGKLLNTTLLSFLAFCLCFKLFEFNMTIDSKNVFSIGIVNLIASITFILIKLYLKYISPTPAEKLMVD